MPLCEVMLFNDAKWIVRCGELERKMTIMIDPCRA